MNRLVVACLTALLACSTPTLHAQVNARAYAPENLRTLSVQDQQRVISQEYAEQSGGRRIPDDQMRFYLDQVNRSSWGFSRVKQDIATSLGGSGGGWNPGGGNNGVVRCESNDNRQRVCTTGWRSARLSRQISGTRCVEGNNWGSRNGQVWVSGGCRAEFVEGRGGGPGTGGPGNTIRCESQDNRERSCPTPWRNAALVRQISGSACVQNQTWGMRGNTIWVTRGCRGEFAESRGNWGGGGGGSNYSVTCSSNGNRQQTCAWDSRQGRPVLLEQLSGSNCVENRSWGYRPSMVWVSNGCRARFGAR